MVDDDPWGETIGGTFFRELVETSPDGIWVFDLEGRTIYANAAVADLYGIDRSEVGTLTVPCTLDADGREQFRLHLAMLRQGHFNATDVECQWVRRDGTTLWVLVRESAVRAVDGTVIGVLHCISDYSHRRATHIALTRAQAELADKVVQYDLLQGVASAANDANSLIEILGRGRDLLLLMEDWDRAVAFLVGGDALTRVYPVAEDSDAERADDAAHPERAARELEVATHAWQVGTKVWDDRRETLAFPIMHLGRTHAMGVMSAKPPVVRFELIERMVDHVVLQLEHVLERELSGQSLAEARDAAMIASQQKSDFLATVSHEIRTPLNGVLGLDDLLLETDLDDEQRQLATGIQSSGQLLLSLINDILDFSKIEAGRIVLERIDFDVRAVLDQVVAPISGAAAAKGLGFDVAYGDEVPDLVRGDPTKVSQVLANLLTNAVKFTERGSVNVVVGADPVDDSTLLTVHITDTGIGIDEDAADVFAPFQQADSSTTRVFGGSGLGLAISRELARAMGGDVGFHSGARGSIFWFTVLVDPVTASARPVPKAVPDLPDLAPRRVLVVEDNEINQLVASGLLDSLGHSSDVAADGLIALDLLDRKSYDMVLMDIQMPRLDGYAATARIRAAEAPHERIPIVAMTANAVEGERERCLAAGMDDFLTKPVSRADLARTLATWLGEQAETVEAPSSPPSGVLLDRDRLNMLRDMDEGDTTYLDRVLDRFGTNAPEQVAAIRSAASAGSAQDLRFHAHKLAGTTSNVGLVRVAELALDLERLGAADTTTGANAVIERLSAALDASITALKTYRPGRSEY